MGAFSLATDGRRRHGILFGPDAIIWITFASNLYTPFSLTVISGMSGWVFSSRFPW